MVLHFTLSKTYTHAICRRQGPDTNMDNNRGFIYVGLVSFAYLVLSTSPWIPFYVQDQDYF